MTRHLCLSSLPSCQGLSSGLWAKSLRYISDAPLESFSQTRTHSRLLFRFQQRLLLWHLKVCSRYGQGSIPSVVIGPSDTFHSSLNTLWTWWTRPLFPLRHPNHPHLHPSCSSYFFLLSSSTSNRGSVALISLNRVNSTVIFLNKSPCPLSSSANARIYPQSLSTMPIV